MREGARSMIASEPLSVRHLDGLSDIPRDAWNRLFPRRAENWNYFRACEQAAPDGFATSAIGAYSGDTLVAAAPLFRTDYRLDMSLEGRLKPVGDWLYRNTPKLVVVPVLGMGSPLTEECPIGIAPHMTAAERTATFATLLDGMDRYAVANEIPILALQDVTDRDAAWATEPLRGAGFTRVATLPVATLHLPYKPQPISGLPLRRRLTFERFALASWRRSLAARGGLVRTRRFGTTAAVRIRSMSRSRAS